jgi:NACalpha-BTF3-like transcription factor
MANNNSRPNRQAAHFASRRTVVTSEETWELGRDTDGDYYIEKDDITIFLGQANVANSINDALTSLLDANDEVA